MRPSKGILRKCAGFVQNSQIPQRKIAEGLTVLICGAGNGGHALAGVAAHRGAKVHVYTPFQDQVDKWNAGGLSITCHYATGELTTAEAALVTADPTLAAAGVDIAIVCMPTYGHEATLATIGPHLPHGAAIGTVEGSWWGRPPIEGGVLDKTIFFGMRTLPWAARIREYGNSVDILGTKLGGVGVASSPIGALRKLSHILERAIGVDFPEYANLLGLFALDAGQIIHPGAMYGLLSDWNGELFDEAPLFYHGIDAKTAAVMQAMDAEVIALKDKFCFLFPDLDLSCVIPTLQWLQDSYRDQIADSSTFQSSFNTNSSYAGLRLPMKEISTAPGKFIPLFDYRYLTADVPYGLVVIRGMAEIVGHPTPVIDKVIVWAQQRLGKEWIVGGKLAGKDLDNSRAPQKFGIETMEDLMRGVMA